VFRSEFTLSCSALTLALVIGPCGGLGGLEAEVSVGHPVSISVAYSADFDLRKFVADNFIPELPNVDFLEMNITLVHVDMRPKIFCILL
jgi:hypothetical protein